MLEDGLWILRVKSSHCDICMVDRWILWIFTVGLSQAGLRWLGVPVYHQDLMLDADICIASFVYSNNRIFFVYLCI